MFPLSPVLPICERWSICRRANPPLSSRKHHLTGANPCANAADQAAASLSIVPVLPEQPPEPPAHLSEGATAVWIELFEVVKPHQMVGAWHLCEGYAEAVSMARSFAAELATLPRGKLRDEAARSLRASLASVAMLSRSLRLTPRSRLDKREPLKVTSSKKPWELPADDPPDEAG